MNLKLGTRKSLLALSQSRWVAREVEKANPGVKVSLVGIETRGDRILDIPLQGVEGKEFFVAELDDALKSGKVDFTVHSMKDLSLERPKEFMTVAIPIRENPRDVVIFGPGVTDKIKSGKKLTIGTSSPRRLENIPGFLEKALPYFSGATKVEMIEIRGNVNTRLARIQELEGSSRHLDGVVLAFAGLIRMWADETLKGQEELKRLFRGTRWMVLPLRECPTAPAQGALAVECRSNDSSTVRALRKIHDPETESAVSGERSLLAQWGGGCHQRFGVTTIAHDDLGPLTYIRGIIPDGNFVDEMRWRKPNIPSGPIEAWDGSVWRERTRAAAHEHEEVTSLPNAKLQSKAIFIAHSRALPAAWTDAALQARIWTSGTASWFRLAKQGVWVEGCAESLGFESLRETLSEPVLGLPVFGDWLILTHEKGVTEWKEGRPIATYHVNSNFDVKEGEAEKLLDSATHVYWGSGSQFELLRNRVRSGIHHSCGAGKTSRSLVAAGIKPTIFPSVEEWRKWLGK